MKVEIENLLESAMLFSTFALSYTKRHPSIKK